MDQYYVQVFATDYDETCDSTTRCGRNLIISDHTRILSSVLTNINSRAATKEQVLIILDVTPQVGSKLHIIDSNDANGCWFATLNSSMLTNDYD